MKHILFLIGWSFLVDVFKISGAHYLECFSCTDALSLHECKSVETCEEGQVCFKRREYKGQVQYDMGCNDKESCGKYASRQNSSEIAKMSADKTSYCYECCSKDKCNENLCIYPPHSLCQDDKSVDCAKWNSMFDICEVTSEAKKICPRYCNLCDLVDGGWNEWNEWGQCSVSCGVGLQSRIRLCTNPSPANAGKQCVGKNFDVKQCYQELCEGEWTDWETWSNCSRTCSQRPQTRKRSCVKHAFTTECQGNSTELRKCDDITCYEDCYAIKMRGDKQQSGIYNVRLWNTHQSIPVYCDFDTDTGGWTVFQYRFNGSVDFYRNFSDYERGFGSLDGEFWLGLKYMYEMISQGKTELRIDLTAADGTSKYQTFKNFQLDDKPDYTLHIDKGTGTLGDSKGLSFNNGGHFSTYDRDRDTSSGGCAINNHGGWWYRNCVYANLNGEYVTPGSKGRNSGYGGMVYYDFKRTDSLKTSKMMFRRV